MRHVYKPGTIVVQTFPSHKVGRTFLIIGTASYSGSSNILKQFSPIVYKVESCFSDEIFTHEINHSFIEKLDL